MSNKYFYFISFSHFALLNFLLISSFIILGCFKIKYFSLINFINLKLVILSIFQFFIKFRAL